MKQVKIPTVSLSTFLKHSFDIVKNPLPFHKENFEKHGDIFKLNIGFNKAVFFSRDAAFAQYVLQKNQKNYNKSYIQTKGLAKYTGKGLLTAEGTLWRQQRQLIQPAFHKQQLLKIIDVIQAAINLEYNTISPNVCFDIFPLFNDLAFQTVVKSLFSSAASSEDIKQLQQITESAQNMFVKELRQPYLGWWFLLSGKIGKHLKEIQEARQILKRIVIERKGSDKSYNDLLDMLLNARYQDGSAMTMEQLIDEILILFVAGHETTSNALTFTAQLLALHPQWQKNLFDEALANDANHNDLMDRIINSKLCRQVIEEAMRLYPPVYFLDRVSIEEDRFNGFYFKPNSNLLLSVYEIHRHPKLWAQPERFMPSRFANGGQPFSSQYYPFGAGPRKCIGNNFAMFEMILAIRTLVLHYKIAPNFKDIAIQPLISLKPKNALVTLTKR